LLSPELDGKPQEILIAAGPGASRIAAVFKCCSRQLSRVVLSFRFSVLLVDPRSAKAAGAKGINFLESRCSP
jgi:hypothetical protein